MLLSIDKFKESEKYSVKMYLDENIYIVLPNVFMLLEKKVKEWTILAVKT